MLLLLLLLYVLLLLFEGKSDPDLPKLPVRHCEHMMTWYIAYPDSTSTISNQFK